MSYLKGRLRSLLKCAGKGEEKVASVFGVSAKACHQAVVHLRQGAPDVPIWLFTTAPPLAETEVLCEKIYRSENAFALIAGAQSQLWRRWVAINVATWTGDRGQWAMKLAPFLIPPFRMLILNKDGGFFNGTLSNISVHCLRATGDALDSAKGAALEAVHDAGMHVANWLHGFGNWSLATGLLLLTTILRWANNPHLTLFKTIRRDQPLMLDGAFDTASDGEGVARFTQSGPQWEGARLKKLALSSDARWILWQNSAEADPVNISLFNDARTFAVSRQMHFRGWKKLLVATAPFRVLQADEASRVLAPLSDTILVDRKKLLALGIPNCNMAGTAWLILFWKAAAAGWRSYSVGQSDPRSASMKEQPDFPIQDTAFVLRAMLNRALRRLLPRQEDLSRGNVSFAPASLPTWMPADSRSSGRLKVLIVSPFLPYPLTHGGAVRMFNLCRELSNRVDFTLIAMRETNDVVDYATLHQVFREVHVVDRDERAVDDPNLPSQVSASESRSLRALIQQLSQKLLPDLLQIEYTHFAGFRDCAPGVPALLVEHDLTFSLYHQLAESNPSTDSWREYERWLTFERKWLGVYEGVWTVSEEDRARAIEEGHRERDRTFAVANGVDIHRFRPTDAVAETPEMFYVGSFRHLPNIIGFEKLCQNVMPRVWAKAPNARLRVVAGPDHEFFWKKFGREALSALDSRIEIHGFVEDLRPLYARASVVVIPLEVSAGTNIKVLEAMACGKAIVTTPVGCAGLGLQDEYHAAIRHEWSDFSDAVCELLSEPALRAGLGMRARRAAENHFSWTAIADHAYESYAAIAGQPSYSGARTQDRSMSAA